MSRTTLKEWITEPYKGIDWLEALLESIDQFFDKSGGFYDSLEKLKIWDIDAITDEYVLDLMAFGLGLWGWDKTWNLATKKVKLKIGLNLKRNVGTPYAVKQVPIFVLDPDKFDEVLHPITLVEGAQGLFYDGTAIYDGTYTYTGGGGEWWNFSLIIPYDGIPTDAEITAVTEVVESYKRLVCKLTSITFVPLQTKFLHFRPPALGTDFVLTPHDNDLNFVDGGGDSVYTIFGKIWYEGFSSPNYPIIMTKELPSSSSTELPYLLYGARGTSYTSPMSILIRHLGVNGGPLDGTYLRANKMNSFVVTNNAGILTLYQSWADDQTGVISTNTAGPLTTSVSGATNAGPLYYGHTVNAITRQPWGYIKDFGGVDRIWSSSEIDDFLQDNNFTAYSLKKVSNLIDDNGNPLLNSDSPTFFHRMNEETGTTVAEFQGKTQFDATILNSNWDTFLSPFGGSTVTDDKTLCYFPMNENTASMVYKDKKQADNSYLLEGIEPSEDWAATSRLGTGVEVASGSVELTGHFPTETRTISSEWAYSFWFWPHSSAMVNKIFYRNLDSNGRGIYAVTNASSRMEIYVTDGTGNNWKITTTGAFTSTTPHWIVLQHAGGSSANFQVYWNGVSQGSATVTGTISTWNTGNTALFIPETIETVSYGTPTLDYFEAFAEYSEVLTGTEITNIYNRQYGLKFTEIE